MDPFQGATRPKVKSAAGVSSSKKSELAFFGASTCPLSVVFQSCSSKTAVSTELARLVRESWQQDGPAREKSLATDHFRASTRWATRSLAIIAEEVRWQANQFLSRTSSLNRTDHHIAPIQIAKAAKSYERRRKRFGCINPCPGKCRANANPARNVKNECALQKRSAVQCETLHQTAEPPKRSGVARGNAAGDQL
jgi:hypothetical protein